jgi:hypothetical protein
MKNTFKYLYNIGGKDIVKHLAYLELNTILKRASRRGQLNQNANQNRHYHKMVIARRA